MFKRLFNPSSIFEEVAKGTEYKVSIKSRTYNKLYKALDHFSYKCGNEFLDVYFCPSKYNAVLFHIKDKQMAHALYLAINQNSIEALNKFNNLKFLTIDKEEQVAFILSDLHSLTKDDIKNLLSTVDEFSNLLSTDETKLYIDYYRFFDYEFTHDAPFSVSLFLALTTKQKTLSRQDLNEILNNIFDAYYNGYNMSFSAFKYHILNDNKKFFSWLHKGVYIGEFACFFDIPFPMFVNFIKYALDESSFSNIHEFFSFDKAYENVLEESNFNTIINENIFTSNLKLESENEYFVNYVDKQKNKFSKLKNSSYGQKLQNIIAELETSSELVHNLKVVNCTNDDYWLFSINPDSKFVNFDLFSHHFILCDEHFTSFLVKFHDVFYAKSIHLRKSIEKLQFQSGTNLLRCLCCGSIFAKYEGLNDICFGDFSKLAFEDNTANIKFDYILVIMMLIREYLSIHAINVDDIYDCEFAKILHPSFMKLLIEYINSGTYDSGNVPKELAKSIIIANDSSKIEFVESIPLDDPTLLARISFFKDVTVNENLVKAVDKEKEVALSKGFLPLDNFLENIDSYSLNRKNLSKVLLDYNKLPQSFFLAPEKVIVSRELTSDKTYQIVGVIWNHSCLKNAIEVLKSDHLDCKHLYLFIADVLSIYALHGCSFKSIPTLQHHLMIDMSDNKPVLSRHATKNITCSKNANYSRLHKYYKNIIELLEPQSIFRPGYDILTFDDLAADCEDTEDATEAYESFLYSAKHLILCKKHNRWHTKNGMCPSCKKIFKNVGCVDKKETVYLDKVASFQRISFSDDVKLFQVYSVSPIKLRDEILKQVELGIDYNLYDKFVGLVPKKIIIAKASNNKKYKLGILSDRLDFTNIINLDSFKNVQRLKLILVLYKKLLPYILDGSFIATDSRIFETMFMHKSFKGEILIPNLPLMECDVVISQDKNLKQAKSQKTKEIFATFIKNYIMTDEFLSNMVNSGEKDFVDIIRDIEQLQLTEDVIRSCLNSYSNFCLVHSRPYSNKNKLCPICIADGIDESSVILTDKAYFDKLSRQESKYDGGEANIYPYSKYEVQKIFKNVVDLKFKSQILAKALQRNKIFHQFNKENPDIKIISVKNPLYMFENGAIQLKGFTQLFIQGSYKISSLKDVNFVKEQGYKREDIVEILIKVCKGIEFLHANGGFIGDLNGGNILIKGKQVYFIDIDGMSFDEVRNSVYTNMYIYPPSAESNNITAQDDWYSLAIQAFYYLTYSHPFRGICDNKKVPSNEIERMKLGLSVIGNHSIVAPSISIGWHFLPDYLLKYFLDTFEGNKRESMLSVLQKYHEYLLKNKLTFSNISRQHPVKLNINEYAYIDTSSNLICNEQIIANVSGCKLVISREDGFLVVLQNSTYFYNAITKGLIQINKPYHEAPINILNGKIYYTSQNHRSILVDDDFSDPNNIPSHVISKPTDNRVVALSVIAENRIVFVEKNDDHNSYDIYCNSIKITSVVNTENSISERSISIRYDKLSQKWLVVFPTSANTMCVCIESDTANIGKFEISNVVSCSSCFYGNSLYFVAKGEILCYNTNRNRLQRIECSHASPLSIVDRRDNKFVIINTTSAYMYEKP